MNSTAGKATEQIGWFKGAMITTTAQGAPPFQQWRHAPPSLWGGEPCGIAARSTTRPLEERKTAWERRCVSITSYQQKTELSDLKVACPELAEVSSQVLQDVILRVERAYQRFFARVKEGKPAGCPRFQAALALTPSPIPTMGTA